jgi:hypothetical protein
MIFMLATAVKKYGNVKEERLNMGFIYRPQYIKPLTSVKYITLT